MRRWLTAAGRTVLAALTAIIVLATGFRGDAQAFERIWYPRDFSVWEWQDMPIPYTVDLASLAANPVGWVSQHPFDPIEAIHRAFELWGQAGTYVRFRYVPDAVFDPRNPQPLIIVQIVPPGSPLEANAITLATRWNDTMIVGKIVIVGGRKPNGFYWNWNECSFIRTVAHELGHLLGFYHSKVERGSLTGPIMGSGQSCTQLHWDDIAGMQYLYPTPRLDGAGGQRVAQPEVRLWPDSGPVSSQGADLVMAALHSGGPAEIAAVQVLINGQDITAGVALLFQTLGRLTPHGYVLSIPKWPTRTGMSLWRSGVCEYAIGCLIFPEKVPFRPSFTLTLIVRDRSGQEARAERTYTITP